MLQSATGYGFSLADARSICLKDCPAKPVAGNLTWVCEYPSDVVAWATPSSAPVSLADWSSRNYDYFALLNATAQLDSCKLLGPCFPVLTAQANVWSTCQTQTLKNLPLSTAKVDGLERCIDCCKTPDANTTSSCNATASAACFSRRRSQLTRSSHTGRERLC